MSHKPIGTTGFNTSDHIRQSQVRRQRNGRMLLKSDSVRKMDMQSRRSQKHIVRPRIVIHMGNTCDRFGQTIQNSNLKVFHALGSPCSIAATKTKSVNAQNQSHAKPLKRTRSGRHRSRLRRCMRLPSATLCCSSISGSCGRPPPRQPSRPQPPYLPGGSCASGKRVPTHPITDTQRQVQGSGRMTIKYDSVRKMTKPM